MRTVPTIQCYPQSPATRRAFAFLEPAMTREQFECSKTLPHIFGTYEIYRRSLPKREWVQSESGGWVTSPWPWDAD